MHPTRMHLQRIALIAGWIVISLLAVAGFAAFSTPDRDPGAADVIVASDVGRSAGAVSALAFTYLADPGNAPVTTVDLDAAVQSAIARRVGTTTTTTASGPDDTRDGTTFIRSRYLSESEIRALVTASFAPEDVNRAIRIAWCESGFNPAAVNPATGAAGLFQLPPGDWAAWASAAGHPGADILDPEANVAVAAWLLYEQPGGWSHWECRA